MSQLTSSYVVTSPGSLDNWTLVQRELPELTANQVLIRMECSTINPSDYLSILGGYPVASFPLYTGYEGSGTVVKAGESAQAQSLLDQRVAALAAGTWSEYLIADSGSCFPLEPHVTFEQAADLIVNPMTVAYMVELVQSKNTTFVQNAAASSLGKQLTQLATRLGIKHINLVRKAEQVEALKSLGAEFVFNTSVPGWKEEAKKVAQELKTSVGLDAIGGVDTEVLAELLENKGTVYNYGLLSGESPRMSSLQLMFQLKTLTGLWLRPYLFGKSVEDRREFGRFVQRHIDILGFKWAIETRLDGLRDALVRYMENPTGNKVLIRTRIN